MATGSSLDPALERISKNHLECSICQERYHQPKILTCLHSFCEKCLEQYHSKQCEGAQKIPCPLCQQETVLPANSVSALKTNFQINSLMDDVALQQEAAKTAVACEICPQNVATHRCLDCSKNLCSNCQSMHRKFPDLSDHTVATLKDICEGKVSGKKRKSADRPGCEKHPGEVKRFFCEKCEELICRDCTVVDHPISAGHRYFDSNDASVKRRKSLMASVSGLVRNRETLQDALTAIPEMRQTLTRNIAECIKQVHTSAEKMRERLSMVNAEENRLIQQIKNLEKERVEKFDARKKELDTLLQRNEHSTKIARDISDTASDTDFLSLYPEIKRNLKGLRNAAAPRVDRELSFLKFQQRQMVDEINLGRLIHSSTAPSDLTRYIHDSRDSRKVQCSDTT